MWPSVREAFTAFTMPLEGSVPCMYLDTHAPPLVTAAIGCLADPVSLALPMPWLIDGRPATRAEVLADFQLLKARPELAHQHWRAAMAVTRCRLDDAGIAAVVAQRLAQMETELRRWFVNWDRFPADGQMACFGIAWACGAGFPRTFTAFRAKADAQDWAGAQAQAHIRTDGNPGIVPRNAQVALCCANAAASVAQGLPSETLFWPSHTPDAHERDIALQAEAAAALARWADRERDGAPSAGANLEGDQ